MAQIRVVFIVNIYKVWIPVVVGIENAQVEYPLGTFTERQFLVSVHAQVKPVIRIHPEVVPFLEVSYLAIDIGHVVNVIVLGI